LIGNPIKNSRKNEFVEVLNKTPQMVTDSDFIFTEHNLDTKEEDI